MRMKSHRERQAGFTLIELLVVIAIVGVLGAIAIPQFAHQQAKAYEARLREDIRNVALAQEAHWDVAGVYYSGGTCDGIEGVRLSGGTLCVIEAADAVAFRLRTSHPKTAKQCVWDSTATPSLSCS